MWNRACPLCFAKVSRFLVLSRSNDMSCPTCHAALELSRPSRLAASFAGLLAAAFSVHLTHSLHLPAPWFLAMVASILAFGIVSSLVLWLVSDLVVRPQPAAATFPHQHG